MRTFKITGGPSPTTIKVVDSETGVDLTSNIRGFTITGEAEKLMRVTFVGIADVDMNLVDEDRPA